MSLLTIAAVIFAIGAFNYLTIKQEKKRTLALGALADRLGWRFVHRPEFSIIHHPSRFELFTTGRGQEIRNYAAGERDGRAVAVFDFSYVTGGGRSRAVWRQTLVHVRLPGVELPSFALRPENAMHKIGGLFGYQDIDIAADLSFSERYLLRGPDEPAIRAVFDPVVRDFFHAGPKVCVEAAGTDLYFWRASRMVAPEEVGLLLDTAMDLAGRFARHAALLPSV